MDRTEDLILHALKARGPQMAETIAGQLGLTAPAVRRHLVALSDGGLVDFTDAAGAVGRPKRIWRLTAAAESRFPDSHASLTLEMIDAIREVHGETGLEALISRREARMVARYTQALATLRDVKSKVARLSELRSEEGYMASWEQLGRKTYMLAENHCPICAAARACQGFCRSELEVFAAVLGSDVSVTREDHILAGARRCAYRIVAQA